MQRTVCGTPKEHCSGAQYNVNKGMHITRVHQTPQEAYACYAKYLTNQGYVAGDNREFRKAGEPTIVLTKKCRFGAQVRGGKGGEKGEKTKRAAFMHRGGTVIAM